MTIKEKVLKRLKENHYFTWMHFKYEKKREFEGLLFNAYLMGKEDNLAEVGKVIDETLTLRKQIGNLRRMKERLKHYVLWDDIELLKQKLGIK